MQAPNWLVLGLGNPLADADGFGPAVIEELRASGDLPPQVELVDVHTDLLGFIDRFAGRDHVILVDAMIASNDWGIGVFSEETFSTWDERSTGVHGLSALTAVKLFRRLQTGGAPPFANPRITLVAHLVDEADFSRAPGPEAVRAGAQTVRFVLAHG
jgi:hydrogenase maturation protease